ncbi:hypothetical protein [Streptomyces sp. G1]|uniref:hypothetical protein n=1 Tax=Streptomyces sp. G1 TaxID=361572 RepID=UPI00202F59E5|nr:hypothetical protein [Streptomyces sp. G1]MCM1974610.1 hypothetical protein [Streptomyces sp. G1]
MTCGLCGIDTGTAHLCARDAARLAARLTDLPTLYAEAAECLVPRRLGFGDIVATKGAAGPRSPLNEDLLDEISPGRAAAVLQSWREDVQRVRWPHHTPPPPATLAATCRWLAMEIDWIAAHYPAAGDLAREVRTLEVQARHVVGDPPPRPKTVGVCIAVTDDHGTLCGATLTHTAGQRAITCRTCHTVYRTEQELLLLLHYQPVAA